MRILLFLILFLLSSRPRPQIQGTATVSTTTPTPIPSVPLSPSSAPSVIPSPIQVSPPPQAEPDPALQGTPAPTGISENSLWDALVVYRSSHNRTPLIREESLCVYARKRVSEHSGRTDLDNHAGFQRDADSGSLFNDTGDFTQVGEVLAYLPSAQNAIQVIEWGWDSSPAHREGLLSNDSTHACIVGTSPFYVGILAHR